jgi:acetyl esterase/lipase
MRWFVAFMLLSCSAAAVAQVPPDLAARVRSLGQTLDPAGSLELYAPMFGPAAWTGIEIERDVAYGSDPLQKLDVYVAEEHGTAAPVVLFVHGGGFTRGDKHGDFQPDNMTLWAARQGMVGVNINYRLAPANPWPAGARDLAAAIAWTRANIARYGATPTVSCCGATRPARTMSSITSAIPKSREPRRRPSEARSCCPRTTSLPGSMPITGPTAT